MSLQTIINYAQVIEIDRRKIVGQTVSRSQRVKTSERSTAQPWRFKVTPPGALKWAESRGMIEVIDLNDRNTEYEISLNNNPKLNYITEYMGSLTNTQLSTITIDSVGVDTVTITDLPTVAANTVMFEPGDLIQPANSRYPYSVATQVTRGLNTTTTLTVNRSLITSEGISLLGQTLKVGTSCTWRVLVSALPTYQLIPMQQVQYTGNFELVERII